MGASRSLILAAALTGLGLVLTQPVAADEREARIDWGQRYTVSAPLAGIVREISIQPGDRVTEGQTLFTLDTRRLRADARAGEAERERLHLELAEADREVERAEELYDRTLIALRELELSRIQRAMAAARLARADAELQKTRVDLEDSVVRAPAAGRILSVTVSMGEAVSPALAPAVLAVLGSTDPMRAETTVDADTAGRLQPGQPARVRLDTGEAFDGSVASVGWQVEDIGFGDGYRLAVHFSAPETARLRAGQSARVSLPAVADE
ncbi:efflux RND transporter periplasmic adaptor subunit [Thioalkalivibrio sp.]|uniref:efflux RND transporter periplasmic adaptor subunit n=1 Tax=Thioalkalivibrio sp. TaxID=2093813 RepID=UPI0012D50F4E|nr:efflux RND transporter periplasmic adaptor subunit [Thioalkalivibrio sp.]TVP81355.1 MAG: efflux RND transporter periplasmic adaptor subunit [Thioalkalivibrio sp.]